MDEEEVWKCPKHPSKRRRTGICPTCLKEKLAILCPDCAHLRPCACITTTATTSSSSSSSSTSFARFSVSGAGEHKVSNLIDSEPAFRRSRSVAIAFPLFLRSSRRDHNSDEATKTSSFWSMLTPKRKSKKSESNCNNDTCTLGSYDDDRERIKMMSKSRSVAVTSSFGLSDVKQTSSKSKAWYFPSPMKVFRQSSRVHKERSPLYRG
ncbi:hypothetical protein ACFE04_031936 [Oxalis oulophora]